MDVPTSPPLADIDLADVEFWTKPLPEREAASARLRREAPISFVEEQPIGPFPPGPGYWAITRHADVVEASRQPELFCSGDRTSSTCRSSSASSSAR